MKRYIKYPYADINPDEIVRTPAGAPKVARKIYPSLQWNIDGSTFEVLSVNRDNSTAVVSEEWISEDGTEMHEEDVWRIVSDNRSEFVCPRDNIRFRLHSLDADNTIEVRKYQDSLPVPRSAANTIEDEYSDWDDEEYTPSAAHGDYSPSHPWGAPGMKMSDFF